MSRQTTPFHLLLCLVLAAWIGCGPTQTPGLRPQRAPLTEVDPLDPTTASSDLIEAHNKVRHSAGLDPLKPDSQLTDAALAHVQEMAERSKMTHRGANGSSPIDRIERAGFRPERTAENIAYGQSSVSEVMESWMRSPGHKTNILGKYSRIGTACSAGKDGRIYWCVTFGRPAT